MDVAYDRSADGVTDVADKRMRLLRRVGEVKKCTINPE